MKTRITTIALAALVALGATTAALANESTPNTYLEKTDPPSWAISDRPDATYYVNENEGKVRCVGTDCDAPEYLPAKDGVLLAQADTAEPDATSAADIAAGVMDEPPVEQPATQPAEKPAREVVLVEKPSETVVTMHRIATMALEILALPLALLIAMLLRRAIKWVAGKADIELSASQLALVDVGVTKAIGYGEQMARKAIKEHLDYKPVDKLKAALDFGMDLAEKQGWPEWAKDKLEDLIEAKLGEERKLVSGVAVEPSA